LKIENYELWFLAGSFVDQITTKKNGTVVWPSVGMFGGSISLDCFGGFLHQITIGKKGTDHRWQCRIVLASSSLCVLAGSLIKLQITTGKKIQSSGLLTPFATHVTFYFYYVCTLKEEINLT
jgi:hypothetical protein